MADPVTAAGLALAVVPLLISAFENYEITFQPFVTYCRHVKEIERFLARLGIQKTIFLNECELLFMAVSNGPSLSEVFRNPNHPSRTDEQISERLSDLLGSSYSTCVSTLHLINETLNKITLETKDFQYLLEDKETRKAKGKGAMLLFRQKIKISFSKSRLNEIVDELKRHSEDLVILSRQIRELAAQRVVKSSVYSAQETVISQFQVTKQASTRLYNVLANKWSCDDRVEHMASMSLVVDDAERCRHKSSKVCFTLALRCVPQLRISWPDPLWLRIESAPNDPVIPQIVVDMDPTTILQAKLRSVRFDLPAASVSTPSSTVANTASRCSANSDGLQLDLCTEGRLCRYFQKQKKPPTTEEPCMGVLEKSKTFKHFVYASSSPLVPVTSANARSLREILHDTFEERRQEDWTEKLRLARLLALAVLRFQATPWLAESWSSNDIYFFSKGERTQQESALTSPCLNVQLSAKSATANQISHPDFDASCIAPNPALFSLGVALIELGYDAPLQSLRRDDDLKAGASNQFTDYFTAKRLGKLVSKKLNTRYGRLVEKCLTCNFGVGTELESPELQSAVVSDVVNELDECLKAFNAFNMLGI